MEIKFEVSDEAVGFDKVLEKIRDNVLKEVSVTFKRDSCDMLFYEITARVENKIVTEALGLENTPRGLSS